MLLCLANAAAAAFHFLTKVVAQVLIYAHTTHFVSSSLSRVEPPPLAESALARADKVIEVLLANGAEKWLE